MEYMEGLVKGSSTSSSGFSYEAYMKLAEYGGRARFGMDGGYLIGPKEVIFVVLAEFAEGIQRDHECALNTRECKMYSLTEGVYM